MRFRVIREASLHQRLLFLTMATSGIGVLLGCIGFLAYDMHVARQEKMQELRTTGDLVGMNSTAALEFGDEIAGAKLLHLLLTGHMHVVRQKSYASEQDAYAASDHG